MGINYRCSIRRKCGKAVTLNKPIEQYVHKKYKLCPGCGQDTLKEDPCHKKRSKVRGCFCQGNDWPHNKGDMKDKNHICIHVDYQEAEAFILAEDMGGVSTKMRPDDPIPF